MAELKTKANDGSVEDFLDGATNEESRAFAEAIAEIMAELTGEPGRMWGSSIVGFGSYAYRYPTGNSGVWMRTGFSPRKAAMSIYVMSGFGSFDAIMGRLGKHKVGKSCLYVKRASDIDMDVLRELLAASLEEMARMYPDDGPEEAESAKKKTAKKKKAVKKKKAAAKKATKKKTSRRKRA